MDPELRMQSEIARISQTMKGIKVRFEKDDAPVVALMQDVKQLAKTHGLMTQERINSKFMYVSPENRYGDGVIASDVMDLTIDIYGHGFSKDSLLNPTCAELPPLNTPEYEAIKKFNNKVIADSGGQLPPFDEVAKAMSFTCGHTSFTLRGFIYGAPVPDDRPERFESISQDGKLSLTRLQEMQPTYADACMQGIEWDMFRWPFIKAFPWVGSLVQEAGNAGQAISHCESRLEVMLKIAQIAKRLQVDEGHNFKCSATHSGRTGGVGLSLGIDLLLDCILLVIPGGVGGIVGIWSHALAIVLVFGETG